MSPPMRPTFWASCPPSPKHAAPRRHPEGNVAAQTQANCTSADYSRRPGDWPLHPSLCSRPSWPPPPTGHFERSRPTLFPSRSLPANVSACAERNLSSLSLAGGWVPQVRFGNLGLGLIFPLLRRTAPKQCHGLQSVFARLGTIATCPSPPLTASAHSANPSATPLLRLRTSLF